MITISASCSWGEAAVFDKLLAYFAQFPDVWFARHRELAQWALDSEFDEVTYAQRFFAA